MQTQTYDVFMFTGRRKGYLCKATDMWNGSTQLLPYSWDPRRGGFTVNTTQIKLDGATFEGRKVAMYRRPIKVIS